MAADVLNSLGYSHVEPMAPGGGPDGGRDIKFKEGDAPGVAFVTLDKNIRDKFNKDLAKQSNAEGVIALFCNVDVSPSMKSAFAKGAISKGYRLEAFDLERLRSLLDSSLKDIRLRYLKIDDEVAARLRADVSKLLRFPDAAPLPSKLPTMVERLLTNQLPVKLFDLLVKYEEAEIREVPGVGEALHTHLTAYYEFRQTALKLERELMTAIGERSSTPVSAGWRIYLEYVLSRFGGASQEQIKAWGLFLNYGITWDDAERVFRQLSEHPEIGTEVSELLAAHRRISVALKGILTEVSEQKSEISATLH
jgi:hypothetical protein